MNTKRQTSAMADWPQNFQMLKENRIFLGNSLEIAIFGQQNSHRYTMETSRLGKTHHCFQSVKLCLWHKVPAMRKQRLPTNVPSIKGEMPESCPQEPLITSSQAKMRCYTLTSETLSHSGNQSYPTLELTEVQNWDPTP